MSLHGIRPPCWIFFGRKMLVGGGRCENICFFFAEDVVVDVFVSFFLLWGKLVDGVMLIYKVSWVSDERMSNLNWLCYTKSVWVYEYQRATRNGGWALGIVLIVYSMSAERNGKLQLVCDLTSFNCLEICCQEEAWNLRTKVFQDNMHASKSNLQTLQLKSQSCYCQILGHLGLYMHIIWMKQYMLL